MAEKMYNVSLEINVTAESPLSAAMLVQDWLNNDADRVGWQYYVQDASTKELFSVDLNNEDEYPVLPVDLAEYSSVIEK